MICELRRYYVPWQQLFDYCVPGRLCIVNGNVMFRNETTPEQILEFSRVLGASVNEMAAAQLQGMLVF